MRYIFWDFSLEVFLKKFQKICLKKKSVFWQTPYRYKTAERALASIQAVL